MEIKSPNTSTISGSCWFNSPRRRSSHSSFSCCISAGKSSSENLFPIWEAFFPFPQFAGLSVRLKADATSNVRNPTRDCLVRFVAVQQATVSVHAAVRRLFMICLHSGITTLNGKRLKRKCILLLKPSARRQILGDASHFKLSALLFESIVNHRSHAGQRNIDSNEPPL